MVPTGSAGGGHVPKSATHPIIRLLIPVFQGVQSEFGMGGGPTQAGFSNREHQPNTSSNRGPRGFLISGCVRGAYTLFPSPRWVPWKIGPRCPPRALGIVVRAALQTKKGVTHMPYILFFFGGGGAHIPSPVIRRGPPYIVLFNCRIALCWLYLKNGSVKPHEVLLKVVPHPGKRILAFFGKVKCLPAARPASRRIIIVRNLQRTQ